MAVALVNARVLGDDGLVDGRCVLLEGARILDVVAESDPRCQTAERRDLGGRLLLPGFIDSQVNGGGGVLFNDAPSVAAIRAIGAAHRRFGTTGFLPTLISDDLDTIGRGIAAVQASLDAGMPGVLGIHIEGPFLNWARRGVHDSKHLRLLDTSLVSLLSRLRGGRTVVTLAPEMTTPDMVAQLAAGGVLVSAGHSEASYAETTAAIAHGLRGFTHLFNAMARLEPREPGIVGAALYDENTWCGIIVDGHHVDPVMLKLALRCKRHDRFMLVTDAMPIVGSADFSVPSSSSVLSLLPSFTKITSLGIKSFCRTIDNRRLNSRMTSSSLYAGTTMDTSLTGLVTAGPDSTNHRRARGTHGG